jgi:hypothetical protein
LSKQPPRLEGGLIVRKGEAAPAVVAQPAVVAPSMPTEIQPPPSAPVPKGIAGTIAVTVRLDPDRYERLKVHGARRRQTNQQIIVAALDTYLASGDA